MVAGYTEQNYGYVVQKACDKAVSDRFSYDATTGIYKMWLWTSDLAHDCGTTHARTEVRFYNDYTGSGKHQFSADVFVPNGTDYTNIF